MIGPSSLYAFLALLWVALVTPTTALYTKKGPVTQLTPKTFGKAVLDSDLPAMVEFYAPWCVQHRMPLVSDGLTYRDKL